MKYHLTRKHTELTVNRLVDSIFLFLKPQNDLVLVSWKNLLLCDTCEESPTRDFLCFYIKLMNKICA